MSVKGITVVKFSATWCGPCKMLAPVMDEVKRELDDVTYLDVDIEENKELTEQFEVMSVPTIVVLKDGKCVATHNGFAPKEAIIELIREAM